MFGDNVKILEDLSEVIIKNSLGPDFYIICGYLAGVLVFASLFALWHTRTRLVDVNIGFELANTKHLVEETITESSKRMHLVNAIGRINEILGNKFNIINMTISGIAAVTLALGLLVGCIAIDYTVHKRNTPQIQHCYVVEIEESVPSELFHDYEIVEWRSDDVCVIKEKID